MKKLLLLLTLVGFTTIGYFSSKNLIAIKGKILKLENYTFLQIILDEELYVSDYNTDSGVTFHFDLGTENVKNDYAILIPISNETKDRKVHLILLNESEIEAMKQKKIMDIEISLGYSTTYSFKNIQEPNFFINQLK